MGKQGMDAPRQAEGFYFHSVASIGSPSCSVQRRDAIATKQSLNSVVCGCGPRPHRKGSTSWKIVPRQSSLFRSADLGTNGRLPALGHLPGEVRTSVPHYDVISRPSLCSAGKSYQASHTMSWLNDRIPEFHTFLSESDRLSAIAATNRSISLR